MEFLRYLREVWGAALRNSWGRVMRRTFSGAVVARDGISLLVIAVTFIWFRRALVERGAMSSDFASDWAFEIGLLVWALTIAFGFWFVLEGLVLVPFSIWREKTAEAQRIADEAVKQAEKKKSETVAMIDDVVASIERLADTVTDAKTSIDAIGPENRSAYAEIARALFKQSQAAQMVLEGSTHVERVREMIEDQVKRYTARKWPEQHDKRQAFHELLDQFRRWRKAVSRYDDLIRGVDETHEPLNLPDSADETELLEGYDETVFVSPKIYAGYQLWLRQVRRFATHRDDTVKALVRMQNQTLETLHRYTKQANE